MERSSPMDSEAKNKLLKEIEELKKEIEEVKKRVPPHSVRYEILQLLEEKEEELARKQLLLKTWEERAVK
jgi:DNA-binding winged helix-turn-helix (wHTH) protein